MGWGDNEPELQEMRKMLGRLGDYMNDSVRNGFAAAAVQSMLRARGLPSADLPKVVILTRERPLLAFSREGTQMLVLERVGGWFFEALYLGQPKHLRYFFGDKKSPIQLDEAQLKFLHERGREIGDNLDELIPPGSGGGGNHNNVTGENGRGGEPPGGAGDRGGEPPGGAGGGGGDGDAGDAGDGTGGLIEVVSHPVLFSVSSDDYQTILGNY